MPQLKRSNMLVAIGEDGAEAAVKIWFVLRFSVIAPL